MRFDCRVLRIFTTNIIPLTHTKKLHIIQIKPKLTSTPFTFRFFHFSTFFRCQSGFEMIFQIVFANTPRYKKNNIFPFFFHSLLTSKRSQNAIQNKKYVWSIRLRINLFSEHKKWIFFYYMKNCKSKWTEFIKKKKRNSKKVSSSTILTMPLDNIKGAIFQEVIHFMVNTNSHTTISTKTRLNRTLCVVSLFLASVRLALKECKWHLLESLKELDRFGLSTIHWEFP